MIIPETVLCQDFEWLAINDRTIAELAKSGRMDGLLSYGMDGIMVDSRLVELIEFANKFGMTLQQAVELRLKQLGNLPFTGTDEGIKEYYIFLKVVQE